MTKTTEEPTITITSSYKRVKQVAPYETSTAEVTVSEQFFGTIDPEAVAQQSMSQFEIIKSEVLSQLGLPFDQDEATGRIMELFPGTTVVESKPEPKPRTLRTVRNEEEPPEEVYEEEAEEAAPPRRAPRAPRATAPARPAPARRASRQNDDEDPDGLWAELMENPRNWFDNRDDKRNEKAPDFTHKTKKNGNFKLGLWMNQAPSWWQDPYG